jgi:SAM-dependent methyltransferase
MTHGSGEAEATRFYGDLAPWWPVLSPPSDYVEEAADLQRVLLTADRPVREVLELGSGGGSNAVHLREHVALTLVDLSESMLEVSKGLNPDVPHIVGDMRTLRLGREFDAVLIHDAIAYMLTVDDLQAAITTAWEHCSPGGLVVLVPDETTESFEEGTDVSGSDAADGRSARLFEWSYDPDPSDTTTVTEYVFMLKDADGSVAVAHETHINGLFPRATYLELLADAGFAGEAVPEVTTEDRTPREYFVGRKPATN